LPCPLRESNLVGEDLVFAPGPPSHIPIATSSNPLVCLYQCCPVKKRDGYLSLKSHIFSYIDGYVFKNK